MRTRRLLHAAEKVGDAAYVEPRLVENLIADAVCLPLEIAGIGELRLDSPRLCADHRPGRHRRIRACGENSSRHDDQHRHRILFFLGDLTRHVVLRDMRDFVGDDGGQLGLRLRRQDRPRIDADIAAKHGERVD